MSTVTAAETDALNVGGLFEPIGRTPMERAVACALKSAFGGVHWTRSFVRLPGSD